ncbi:MAG: phenylalanine--tRNA ligase subunit beta, partial [Nitrospirota bacterium]|nr:phenylalanine--tRNA ligase subunit beta [Nitrospirota bacterium]
SIGLYRLQKIKFPVKYDLVDPESTSFVPLGFDTPMSLKEIITKHPKGIEYAHTLKGAKQFPILKDAKGEILSFPPIINSRALGEVEVGDSELFVEVTGTDQRMVTLAINIFAANLADRGAEIEALVLNYADQTDFGTCYQTPYDLSEAVSVDLPELNRVLGESLALPEAISVLEAYGLNVTTTDEKLTVRAAPYRDDLMHAIDLIEDFAISRGYHSFIPDMPTTFTVGGLSQIEQFSDGMRLAMVGFGFEEVISNILGSAEDFIEKMSLGFSKDVNQSTRPETQIVAIENPMTERFSLLRSWLVPSLLRVEGASSKAFYPHRIFEAGEVAQLAPERDDHTVTLIHLAALVAHPDANFSELHTVLESLFARLAMQYTLEPLTHASFIDGRSGKIKIENQEIGLIGEIHPKVLDAWQIGMPTVIFEISLEKL